VCLGLIAAYLSADTRRKVLPASFARAMKDPFVHARVAGLRGMTQSHKLLALDSVTLATKIMPSICPLLADPAKEVRNAAFEAMSVMLQTLSEANAQAEQTAAAAAEGGAGTATAGASRQSAPASADLGGFFVCLFSCVWTPNVLCYRLAHARFGLGRAESHVNDCQC